MADGPRNQVDVTTNTRTNSTAQVPVNPLSQVAVAILYAQRVMFGEEEDRARAAAKRQKQWTWEKAASDDALDKAEVQEERSLEDPPGEMTVSPEGPDPQFGNAPGSLETQLEQAGAMEIVRRPLGGSAHVTTRLPLAAVLVISHGTDGGEIIPFTYLLWKYFTGRKPWRQWRDKRTHHGWDLDAFVSEVGIKKRGLLVLYGCDAASPGNSSTRRRSANSAGIAIAGWPGVMEWELSGVDGIKDERTREAWNKMSFKDEEAVRLDLKRRKENLKGTGHARPGGGGALKEIGNLVPPTVTEPDKEEGEDYNGLGSGDVIALVRRAAAAVVKELARQKTQQGSQRNSR